MKDLIPHPEHLIELLSKDPSSETTHCQMIASFLLSEAQASGSYPLHVPPSYMLVNAGHHPDPCKQAANAAFHCRIPRKAPPPETPQIDPLTNEPRWTYTMKVAETAMGCHIRDAKKVNEMPRQDGYKVREWRKKNSTEAFQMLYGTDAAGLYSRHIREDFGVASDIHNRASLWVRTSADFARFQDDLKNPESLYWKPWGYNREFEKRKKHVSLNGAISHEQWSTDLVHNIVTQAAPIVFLPHVAVQASPDIDGFEFYKILKLAASMDREIGDNKLNPTPHRHFPGQYVRYELLVRHRLRNMPDYEIYVRSLFRSVFDRYHLLCLGVSQLAPDDKKDHWLKQIMPLMFENTVRGITMGVESLVFHGIGILGWPDIKQVAAVLNHLRQRGPCTPRELLKRFQSMNADARDKLLTALEQECLIIRDKKHVTAVSCRQFIESLPYRQTMPPFLVARDNLPPCKRE